MLFTPFFSKNRIKPTILYLQFRIFKQSTPEFIASIVAVFSGLAILFPNENGLVFSVIITTFFALFAVTVWGIFFASEIMCLNREHQWHLKEKQA